jgi:hypothetical protein
MVGRGMAEAKTGRGKRWWYRLVAAVAGPVLLVAGCEGYLRLTLFSPLIQTHPASPGANHPQYLFMPDPETNYTLRPFFQGEDANPSGDFKVPVTINSLGLRDGSLKGSVRQDRRRIFFLGDSFVYGEGVRWEDSYPAKLEQTLNDDFALPVQVLNGGVPAYGLDLVYARFQKYQPLLKPDLTVVCWLPWGFYREGRGMAYLNGYLVEPTMLDRLHVVGNNIFYSRYSADSLPGRADLWLQSHSFVWLFISYELHGKFSRWFNRKLIDMDVQLNIPPAYLTKCLDYINRMDKDSKAGGARFALVLLTSNPKTTGPIADYCRQNDIAMISLAEGTFTKDSPYRDFQFPHDYHFNEKGQAYLTRELAPFLANQLSPPRSAPP